MNRTGLVKSEPTTIATMRDLMEKNKQQFAMALPKHMSVERLLRIGATACQRNPRLLECTPKSFLGALMTAAQLGLEPDGTLGRAYLIPRNNRRAGVMECHFQPGYLGLIELCHRSGEIASVRADVVRRGDFFEYEKGLTEKLVHREGDNPEAEITHVYAIITTKGGGRYWDVWTSAKVEAHRQRFSQDSRDDSAWNTDWPSMAKKTLLLAVQKLAPKSVEQARAIAVQEQSDAGLPQDIGMGDFGNGDDPGPTAPTGKPKSIDDIKVRERAKVQPAVAEALGDATATQPAASAAPAGPEKITPAQVKEIGALLSAAGVTEAAALEQYCDEQEISRDRPKMLTDLRRDEADVMLAMLKS